MLVLFCPYPISNSFKKEISTVLNSGFNEITLGKLRSYSALKMIRILRSINGEKVIIPLEDANSKSIVPILSILALLTRVKQIWTIDAALVQRQVNHQVLLAGICRMILSSLSNMLFALKTYMDTSVLLKKDIIQPSVNSVRDFKKITYLKTNLWFGVKAGGSVGHIAGVVNAFTQKGYNVSFYGVEPPPMVNDAKFHQLPVLNGFGLPPEFNMYAFDRKSYLFAEKRVKKEREGFIYQRMSLGNYTGVTLSRKFDLPLVLEYNGSEVWIQRNWGKKLKFERLAKKCEDVCLKHAHVIVTVSQSLKDQLVSRGIPEEKIVFYPNCIDPEIFDPESFSLSDTLNLRQRYSISNSSIVCTFLGTFGQWHGVEIIAQAVKRLVDTRKEWLQKNKVHFLIIGDGLKMSNVREILSGDMYEPFFTLTGLIPQEEAPLHLFASDILLSPHIPNPDGSPFFGSPTKLFEYMAMGKAIIASDLDQIGDVLKNSIRCKETSSMACAITEKYLSVLTEPGSCQDLIKSIEFLVENEVVRKQIGVNARNEALNRYTWERHVDAVIDRVEYIVN